MPKRNPNNTKKSEQQQQTQPSDDSTRSQRSHFEPASNPSVPRRTDRRHGEEEHQEDGRWYSIHSSSSVFMNGRYRPRNSSGRSRQYLRHLVWDICMAYSLCGFYNYLFIISSVVSLCPVPAVCSLQYPLEETHSNSVPAFVRILGDGMFRI